MPHEVELSVVVPLFNEAESLGELSARLCAVLDKRQQTFELLFVDDGSTDESLARLEQLSEKDPRIGIIELRRNFGKAAALNAGFRRSRGRIVATLDADLQDVPEELPKLLDRLLQGFDVVSGWKAVRRDPWSKRLPSRVFNAIVRRLSGVALHDFNSGFKVYRSAVLGDLELYGELHRYVPVLLAAQGFKVGEVSVEHAPRRFGYSKYGAKRLLKGFFDLLTVMLHTRFRARPLHLFGFLGLGLGALGVGLLGYLTVLWFLGARPIGQRPLLFLGMLLVMVGAQLVSTGLLGELISRRDATSEPGYLVKSYAPPREGQPLTRRRGDLPTASPTA